MKNNSVRLTMAQAIVRYLVNQYTEIDGGAGAVIWRRIWYFWAW